MRSIGLAVVMATAILLVSNAAQARSSGGGARSVGGARTMGGPARLSAPLDPVAKPPTPSGSGAASSAAGPSAIPLPHSHL